MNFFHLEQKDKYLATNDEYANKFRSIQMSLQELHEAIEFNQGAYDNFLAFVLRENASKIFEIFAIMYGKHRFVNDIIPTYQEFYKQILSRVDEEYAKAKGDKLYNAIILLMQNLKDQTKLTFAKFRQLISFDDKNVDSLLSFIMHKNAKHAIK